MIGPSPVQIRVLDAMPQPRLLDLCLIYELNPGRICRHLMISGYRLHDAALLVHQHEGDTRHLLHHDQVVNLDANLQCESIKINWLAILH